MNSGPNTLREKLKSVRRKPIGAESASWVKAEPLAGYSPLPLLFTPAMDGIDLANWTENNREELNRKLLHHGGLLFRNFGIETAEGFEKVMSAMTGGPLLDYVYRSTPRTRLSGKVYTSTEYPARQTIPLHNENAYTTLWPMKIWFFCMTPAGSGGETPIADSRRVFRRLDPAIRKPFMEKRVLYVRNYGELDLKWQEVFQTEDRGEVEAFCRGAGIEAEWRDGDRLRTRQLCQAVANHPRSGDTVWFNQAHLFHVSSLEPEIAEALLSTVSEEELPRNAFFGDGSRIPASMIDEINGIYREEAVVFPWQRGDLLMLDNMLAAHGRLPFEGNRKVVVGMAEPSRDVSGNAGTELL